MTMGIITVGQFLLLLMACNAHVAVGSFNGSQADRISLLEFKKAISDDPQRVFMSWNDSIHFCSWEGVLCRLKNPHRVTSLDLGGRGLVGTISPSLGNLTFLKYLFLPNNGFIGEIPPSLGHLRRIQYLCLSNNTLQGQTPDFANCSSLKKLWLDGNHFVGQMPILLDNMPTRLQYLQISRNNLTGTIPPSIGNFTTLAWFYATYNQIHGEIPSQIGNLPVLQVFKVTRNKLSGKFQLAILNLSSIVDLRLSSNYLNGELPSSLGSSFPNLQFFSLYHNFFNGHIPRSLANASKLIRVDLSDNNFTGVVPSSIGKLEELWGLNLQTNQLHARSKQDWDFMYSLTNCTKLWELSLMDNQLEGQIPDSLGNLSMGLQMLYLGNNRVSGSIPTGIANLRSLNYLELGGNHLTGAILEQLGNLENLREIFLPNNNFTGHIPSSLSNSTQLIYLVMHNNQLDGNIPPSLGKLKVLQVIDFSYNKLHGLIPKEIFNIPTIEIVDFSFNSLDGPIPLEIGHAKQLEDLVLSSNNLSGVIPDMLGNCESLQVLELGQNFLIGSVPASLGNIRNLGVLNMSHNHLSGSIPESIGSLPYLGQIDLSFNYLEGEVPGSGIFKNATAVQIDGNKGLCGGPAGLHLPACPVKQRQSTVLRVVLPIVGLVSLAMIITVVLMCKKRQKKDSVSLPSFGTNFPTVSYNSLARATDGFSASNLIGRGRYSSVYRGDLFQDGNVVAIKVFSLEIRGAQKSFIAECNALRNLRHRNLVPILTACSSIDSEGNDFKALIYKFMPRGDLHEVLYSTAHDENSSNLDHITLSQRLSIMVDVSDALEYLHHSNQGTIVHSDVKPNNILLDENLTAHIGDFGLSRFNIDTAASSLGGTNSTSSIAVRGTIGYVAPECAGSGQVSTATDVYSFGVVLLEIFMRKRPTDDMFKDGLSIVRFAEMNFPDRVLEIVDPRLLQELHPDHGTSEAVKERGARCLVSALDIGLRCTKASPSERISMQEVAAKLHGIKDVYVRGN